MAERKEKRRNNLRNLKNMEDKIMESSLTWNQKLRRDRIQKIREFLMTVDRNSVDIPTIIEKFSAEFGLSKKTIKDYIKELLWGKIAKIEIREK
jgi:chromosomal replication initiation ATPase DnaA